MAKIIGIPILLILLAFSILPVQVQDAFPDGTSLKLLQWHHFVPRYDAWFDAWAQAWGESNNVAVTVDHVNLAELPSSLATGIGAGAGYSIYEMPVPAAAFVEGLRDLRHLNQLARERYGEQYEFCSASAYLPANDKWFGFVGTQVVNHGNYDSVLWIEAGYPAGPQSWSELLEGGAAIFENTGVPVGIGLSPEPDSEMAARSVIWSYGGAVQDQAENVSLNSEATINAVKYLAELHQRAMTDEVFGWGPPSNNQALIAGEASFIFNPNSAYRSLQKVDEAAAAGIGLSGALAGPAGAFVGTNVLTHVIPAYVDGAEWEAAQRFLLDYLASYDDVVWHSELYNLPCYPASATGLDAWLAEDPFGSQPSDKLQFLATVSDWSAQLGYPGVANPAISQVYAENLLPKMVAKVALGELSAEEAVAQTHDQIEAIFASWRERGLVGGGD